MFPKDVDGPDKPAMTCFWTGEPKGWSGPDRPPPPLPHLHN